MTLAHSRHGRRRRAAIATIAAVALVAGCSSDDEAVESLTVADLRINTPEEQLVFEELFPRRAEDALDESAPLTANEATLYLTSNTLYSRFLDQVVADALDDWETTAGRLTTWFPGDEGAPRIEQIRLELEASQQPGGPPVSYETFSDLPDMQVLALELAE